jgi:3-phosphoshikimate 1-carboxyvinyltransferase
MPGDRPALRFYKICGELTPPGDKSLAHRYLFLAPFAAKPVKLLKLSGGMDVRSSIECLRKIGVRIDGEPPEVTVYPFVYDTLKAGLQSLELNCGNSGTTARFLMGFLSAFGIGARISGDESLNRRPMKRAAAPLAEMGCRISLERGENLPEIVEPVPALSGIEWTMKTPSAQVKTAILFAGLRARGETVIRENVSTRNHTEIILKEAGADIHFNGDEIVLHPLEKPLSFPEDISIPGDISTAAFFVTAAAMLGGSELTLHRLLLNPHRAYYLDVLKRMGAGIEMDHEYESFGERAGDVRVEYSGRLKCIEVSGEETVKCIDEIPALAVAASFAKGRSVFRDLEELRVKESDRLKALEFNLQKMGVEARAVGSSLEINGRSTAIFLYSAEILKAERIGGKVEYARESSVELDSFGDHRIAMAMKIASLVMHRDCAITGGENAAISAPKFYAELDRLLMERKPDNIFLAGFMGAGKTTTGKMLAKELDYSFIDLDERVRTTAGKPIWRIFTEVGEDRFRELEKKELMSLAGINRTVVALGGGTTCDFENTTFIYKMGLVILLAAPHDILYARIKDESGRPLYRNEEDFYALFNRRNIIGCYETADFIIDTSRDNPSLIAKSLKKILHHWRERQTGPDSKPAS